MISTDIPIFPLHTVLFPDGYLKLRIFEQRYIDMVRECSLRSCAFGVCLIGNSEGSSYPANHMRVGTTAEICDFSTLDDGLLGITAQGRQKFIIQSTRMRENGLLMARVETLDETGPRDLPEEYSVLAMITGRFMEQVSHSYPSFQPQQLQDAHWVGYRLAELLPLDNDERQVLLQISDPLERLQVLLEVLPRFQEPTET
ncbi:MAG TPA: LON peptidase substrate-binding domain-containing protein [Xanthomonadales bacterium]